MNSLVVLFSVMAIATAAPTDLPSLNYAVPQAAILAAPAVYAPTAYAAAPLAAIAPAAVSTQSRIDIKSTPALVSSIATGPAISYASATPLVYNSPVASIYAPSPIAAVPNVFRSVVVAVNPVAAPSSIQVPAELPQQVTETPEVAAARVAHEEAKTAAEEAHSIQKRSPGLISYAASPAVTYAASPLIHTIPTSHLVYSAPVAHLSPYSVHTPIIARVL